MTVAYGTNYSGTDPLKLAPGTEVDAAVRLFRNFFDLALWTTDTDIGDKLMIGHPKEGSVFDAFVINSSANLSGATFQLGTLDDPDKYLTTFTGPNATTIRIEVPASTGRDALAKAEDIYLTVAGADLPHTGVVTTKLFMSHR